MDRQFFKQKGNYDLAYLRKAKADAIEAIYKKGIPRKDHLCVEKYEQATVLPCMLTENGDKWEKCMAGVADQDGSIIQLSCTWPFANLDHPIGETKYLEKKVIYIGSFRSHWGHFLVDLVPRLWYVLECEKEEIDAYVISGEFHGEEEIQIANIKEFLELLGVLDKIRLVSVPTRFKSVIIPERAYFFGKAINDSCEKHIFSDKYLAVFNYVVDKALKKYGERNRGKVIPKKVFMTRRSDFDYGVELIDSFFENNDYLILDPAQASLTELIVLLNKCEEIAYISGTLQHNMLFAPNGMYAVAIESRSYVSPVQIDIDIMKDIHVTYIDANYSIIKDFRNHSRLYGYTDYFKQYVEDKKKRKPNIFFRNRENLWKKSKDYLHSYCLPNSSRFRALESDYSGYEVIVGQQSIAEISRELNIDINVKYNEKFDRKSGIDEIMLLLRALQVPYGKWKENTYSSIYQTFFDLITYAMAQKNLKSFMIYPYGRNGLLCKLVLKEIFAITPIIFDNKVCQYNTSVRPLKDLERMRERGSIMILTSSKEECVKEIERYYDPEMIFGPYTVY